MSDLIDILEGGPEPTAAGGRAILGKLVATSVPDAPPLAADDLRPRKDTWRAARTMGVLEGLRDQLARRPELKRTQRPEAADDFEDVDRRRLRVNRVDHSAKAREILQRMRLPPAPVRIKDLPVRRPVVRDKHEDRPPTPATVVPAACTSCTDRGPTVAPRILDLDVRSHEAEAATAALLAASTSVAAARSVAGTSAKIDDVHAIVKYLRTKADACEQGTARVLHALTGITISNRETSDRLSQEIAALAERVPTDMAATLGAMKEALARVPDITAITEEVGKLLATHDTTAADAILAKLTPIVDEIVNTANERYRTTEGKIAAIMNAVERVPAFAEALGGMATTLNTNFGTVAEAHQALRNDLVTMSRWMAGTANSQWVRSGEGAGVPAYAPGYAPPPGPYPSAASIEAAVRAAITPLTGRLDAFERVGADITPVRDDLRRLSAWLAGVANEQHDHINRVVSTARTAVVAAPTDFSASDRAAITAQLSRIEVAIATRPTPAAPVAVAGGVGAPVESPALTSVQASIADIRRTLDTSAHANTDVATQMRELRALVEGRLLAAGGTGAAAAPVTVSPTTTITIPTAAGPAMTHVVAAPDSRIAYVDLAMLFRNAVRRRTTDVEVSCQMMEQLAANPNTNTVLITTLTDAHEAKLQALHELEVREQQLAAAHLADPDNLALLQLYRADLVQRLAA